jgi:hypothetical protein
MRRGVRVGTCVTAEECDEDKEGRGVREGRSGEGEVVAVKEGVVEGVVSIVEVEVEERVKREDTEGAPTVIVGVMVPVGMDGKAVIEGVDKEDAES